jgi:hypothetical protein
MISIVNTFKEIQLGLLFQLNKFDVKHTLFFNGHKLGIGTTQRKKMNTTLYQRKE